MQNCVKRSLVTHNITLTFLSSLLLHVVQTGLHVLQVALGYMLMLLVMSYNVWIFLGVILGSTLGYFISFPLLSKKQLRWVIFIFFFHTFVFYWENYWICCWHDNDDSGDVDDRLSTTGHWLLLTFVLVTMECGCVLGFNDFMTILEWKHLITFSFSGVKATFVVFTNHFHSFSETEVREQLVPPIL